MLEMRQNCERCGADLPNDSGDARICSFECTFCGPCADGPLCGACPNCGGNRERRPMRRHEPTSLVPSVVEGRS